MIRVVVVDDEAPICEWLVYCIKKASSDYQVLSASSGLEALNVILREKPDVVFTDIRMPDMDGLELTQRVLEVFPYTVIAILTNYAEFSYAQQAISIGAREYYLKSELRASDIENLLTEIALKKKHLRDNKKSEYLLPDGSVNLYSFFRHRGEDGYVDYFWQQQSMTESDPYVVFSVKADDADVLEQLNILLMKNMQNGPQQVRSIIASGLTHYYVVLQSTNKSDLHQEQKKFALSLEHKQKFSFGFSRLFECRKDMDMAIEEARIAISSLFISEKKSASFESLLGLPKLNRANLRKQKYQIFDSLSQKYFEDAQIQVRKWFANFDNVEAGDIEWSIKYLKRMVHAIEEQWALQNEHYAVKGLAPNKLGECIEYSIDLILSMRNMCSGKISPAIEDALDYIHAHYHRPISMSEVAIAIHRSPEYFSRQFKQEVGENFSVYLTMYRLNHAQKLLKSTDLAISTIAEMVGYSSATYFSRLYKKYKGISPRDNR